MWLEHQNQKINYIVERRIQMEEIQMEERKFYEDKKMAAVRALAEIDPHKAFGTELYNAIARVSISVAIELVALRDNSGVIEILLMQRGPNEAYANMWHCPGSALRPGENEQDVFTRLSQREFQAPIVVGKFVGYDNNPHEERGHFIHFIFLCTPSDGCRGTWFPVDKLPQMIVEHHRSVVIPKAVNVFGA